MEFPMETEKKQEQEGVLLLAHGSRIAETEETMRTIRSYVARDLEGVPVEIGFLQFSETSLRRALETLVKQGATRIKVIPYFLFNGVHIKEDIPAEIAAFAKERPDITVTFGSTLGADPALAKLLVRRIREMAFS
ncbi:MAG: CbiX/SirB N-terminal domain-containing protein [Spirochaetaceae bacterium]|jgi:sirohydrochlorin ferrochelatase|nr:CbiX/SirB N-terminal domain-containing protein [Spirochaetaceae bacterium]